MCVLISVRASEETDGRHTLLSDVGPCDQLVLHILLEERMEIVLHLAVALGERMQRLRVVPSVREHGQHKTHEQTAHVQSTLEHVPRAVEVLRIRLESFYLLGPQFN